MNSLDTHLKDRGSGKLFSSLSSSGLPPVNQNITGSTSANTAEDLCSLVSGKRGDA